MKKQIVSAVAATSFLLGATANAETTSNGVEKNFMPPSVVASTNMQVVDPVELNSTRAGIAPLAFALGVASFDVTLAGFFWGVYMPYYAPQEPAYNYW